MSLSIWFATAALAVQAGSIGALLARKHIGSVPTHNATRPPITILRPVCGLENNLERCLESTFDLRWPSFEVIFCVAHEDDPAAAVVRSLLARHPERDAQLLVGEDAISVNPKMNNLVKGWRSARHDWIVIVDSNVLMPPDQLERMLARWDDETGLVCAPPIGTEPQNFAAEVESVWLNSFQARWQLLADSIGQGFAQGKAMLLNRSIISDLGGFERLGDAVAEDAAATHLVREAGLKVRLVHEPFAQPLGKRSAGSVWKRQLRWARLRRASFPLYFLPEVAVGATLPTLCLAGAAVSGTIPVVTPLVYLALWYSTEILLARSYGWPSGWRSFAAMIVRDLALPPLFIAAWFGSDFVWRGNAMTVAEEGSRPLRLRRAVARTREKARALVATLSH
ncbi:ceramide glucosyltransferase [Peteryoungia ipomoeae]|uniref:Glycosyltransferase n=1 Tax=Peteryoungia ipomoeae TaxID=1210932 RepID=A0A4S8P1F6_9HYPH|nr:ceramide glucosyltransferase [Peteryoungia ipomoeae]THV21434.1 glycosyltransferase [Peteryoungia ipomoeae]